MRDNRYLEHVSLGGRTAELSQSRQGFRRSRSMIGKPQAAEPQGLRQKLSLLRLRLGPSDGPRETKQEDTLFPFGIRGPSGEIHASTPDEELKIHQPRIAMLRPSKTKRRVRRWARGAKNAMRRAMKTLDRSANVAV